MSRQNVKQQRVDKAIDIAAYLEKEIEALKYVIEEVPYDATPPEEYSIAELLMLIDHAQCNYYVPVFDSMLTENKPTHLNNFTPFKETFNPEKREGKDIQEVLSQLAGHRASFVKKLNDITITQWGKKLYKDNQELYLIDFIEKMNHSDQIYLKRITSLTKSYHDEKATQRELKQRQQHNPET